MPRKWLPKCCLGGHVFSVLSEGGGRLSTSEGLWRVWEGLLLVSFPQCPVLGRGVVVWSHGDYPCLTAKAGSRMASMNSSEQKCGPDDGKARRRGTGKGVSANLWSHGLPGWILS